MVMKNKTVNEWLRTKFRNRTLTLSILVEELGLAEMHVGDLTEDGARLYEIIEDKFIEAFLEKEEAIIYRPYNYTENEFLTEILDEYGQDTDLTDLIKLDKSGIEKMVDKIKYDYRTDLLIEVLREKGVI